MSLALFDLDNTLLAGDSDHAWGEFLVEQQLVDAEQYQRENDRFYQRYQQGELNIADYLQFSLQPLVSIDRKTLDHLHQVFMVKKIEPMRLKKADALIEKHKSAGDTLVIITSTNRFITQAIADSLSVDDLLATELELDNQPNQDGYQQFTGNIVGEPCYREGKVTHLSRWLTKTEHSLSGSIFYSDSINDLPLLELVERAVAVDPDPQLRAHAEAKGWSIISLRD